MSKDEDGNKQDNEKLKGTQRTLQSFYRCKVKDKVLYQQTMNAYRPFATKMRLQELLHNCST